MTRAHFDDGMHDNGALARGGYYFAPGTVEEYSPRPGTGVSLALYALAVVLALCLVAAIAVAAGYVGGGPL